jgi:5-methylcytosine-specific restriction endonuclease McrA
VLYKVHWAWLEITRDDHGHGGPGWEFGTCLWSPSRNRAGHDRYRIMREPREGDAVIHCLHRRWPDGSSESRFCGQSKVAGSAREIAQAPPSPGGWAGAAAYLRIDLRGYAGWPVALPLSTVMADYGNELLAETGEDAPRSYPFDRYGDRVRTVQGIYLARATPRLVGLLPDALGIEAAKERTPDAQPPRDGGGAHSDYAEGIRRRRREAFFLSRNPRLARDAKAHHGAACQACGFDFGKACGQLGLGYIECHHLNPLSERPEEAWTAELRTRLGDVAVLCSNCHRMVHRRRPALTIAELRAALASRS